MSDKWCPENDGAFRAELAYIEKHASASRDAAEITRLRAENEALKDRLGMKGAGCACRFEDDGETQTTWCAVHARLRADLAAAQEREQRMREFAEYLGRIKGAGVQVVGVTEGIRKRARAAQENPND